MSGEAGSEPLYNLIDHAQAILWMKIGEDDKLWQSALKCSLGAFPNWAHGTMKNMCHEACHDFNGRPSRVVVMQRWI